MKLRLERVLAPGTGLAVGIKQGEHLRVIDLEGKQVFDMAVFNLQNLREKLSTSNSRNRYIPKPGQQYAPRDHLEEGDWLMSTLCRPMMTIVKETPVPKGVHEPVMACVTGFYMKCSMASRKMAVMKSSARRWNLTVCCPRIYPILSISS